MHFATIAVNGSSVAAVRLSDGSVLETAKAESGDHTDARHAIKDIEFLAPIPTPLKNVFCAGRNISRNDAYHHIFGYTSINDGCRCV